MSVLPKIQALISRAAHPETPVEEARTSAVIAARLIVEHGVVLTEKNGARPIGSPPDGENQLDYIDWFINMMRRSQAGRPWYGREARPQQPPPPAPKKKSKAKGPRTRQKKPPQGPAPPHVGRCPHGLIEIFCPQCNGTPPTRRVYSGVCPTFVRDLTCVCCRRPIRPGERLAWVGEEMIFPDRTPLTHESCVQHWQRDYCNTCGKRTT